MAVRKITWMTQTHSTICCTINEEMPLMRWKEMVGDATAGHALMMMTADRLSVVLGTACTEVAICMHVARLGWRHHRSYNWRDEKSAVMKRLGRLFAKTILKLALK